MKYLLSLFITFSLISCSQPSYVPSGEKILAEEQMMNILIDFHVAEAGVQEGKIKNSSITKHISIYYDHIFRLHGVTEAEFSKTLQYYIEHPNDFDALYMKINERMKLEEEELKNKVKERNKEKAK